MFFFFFFVKVNLDFLLGTKETPLKTWNSYGNSFQLCIGNMFCRYVVTWCMISVFISHFVGAIDNALCFLNGRSVVTTPIVWHIHYLSRIFNLFVWEFWDISHFSCISKHEMVSSRFHFEFLRVSQLREFNFQSVM